MACLRPFQIAAITMGRTSTPKFIPHSIACVRRGERPKLYGDGLNVRDWIHVDDHARAVWSILTKGTIEESYLIGANCERRNSECYG